MVDRGNRTAADTTDAAKSQAESREGVVSPGPVAAAPDECRRLGRGTRFEVSDDVTRAAKTVPYERKSSDPLYRPLWIYALDPAASRLEGAVARVNVPYEPLLPGPSGQLVHIDGVAANDRSCTPVDLNEHTNLLQSGRGPSISDPQFHQQMVYAVSSLVYAVFRQALGRHVAWGFRRRCTLHGCGPDKLSISPHGMEEANAYYDPQEGRLCFGYFNAGSKAHGNNLPHGRVYTCLSHDIIAHETTHALLDGLRSSFSSPTGRDVLAFHEAFADLVAVFQRFTYEHVVRESIRRSRGALRRADVLTSLARQFGHTTAESGLPLRTVIDVTAPDGQPKQYDAVSSEPHELGSVLASAVFEAFMTVFERKTARYVRLATGGSGVLPPGELNGDLVGVLAEEATQLAGQFLNVCVRAIDYCPPVDIEFGEYLRAVITADHDLVPDDPWGYREAWIDAFRRRGIYPRDVLSLGEDSLRWNLPEQPELEPCAELSFAKLAFEGDPGRAAGEGELERQACVLGNLVTTPEQRGKFGLADPESSGSRVRYGLPIVQSIRSSRRVGPDGQIVFDLVAEVLQTRTMIGRGFQFIGGSTIIIGPRGEIRYVIRKRVDNDERVERQFQFMRDEGARYWRKSGQRGAWSVAPNPFQLVHANRRRRNRGG